MPGHDDTLNAGGPHVDPLDALCTCGHRLGDHHTLDEACVLDGCECSAFQRVNPEFGNGQPSDEQLAAIAQAKRDAEPLEIPAFIRQANATRNNTREAVDVWSNDARAAAMDREPMSPTEAMTDEERTESDAVQAETLDNLCECGHRYGDHASTHGEPCLNADCDCVEFDALLKPADYPDHKAPEAEGDRILGDNPFRVTRCAGCGHEKVDHDHTEPHACLGADCKCQAFIEYTSSLDPKGLTFAHDENIGPAPEDIVDASGRKPYTPPLLRKRLIGEAELRQVLADAGRLDLLQQLPEVDRVTTNYDAEHWREIERLALSPQGSSETVRPEAQQLKAIALALLDVRQCLGVSDYTDRLVKHIEANADVIRRTVETLDHIVDRILEPQHAGPADKGEGT